MTASSFRLVIATYDRTRKSHVSKLSSASLSFGKAIVPSRPKAMAAEKVEEVEAVEDELSA